MPSVQSSITRLLYEKDIWDEFQPATSGDMHGRNGDHPSLSRLVQSRGQKIVIDVGVWKGLSTITIARSMNDSGLMGGYYPPSELQKFRYLIDVDGNTNAWSGLFERLISGSPVLKVESELAFRQWYYDRLRPWHHFVPVMADMADLISKIDWLICHDDEAKRIGQNGRELALSLEYETEIDCALDTSSASFRAYSYPHGG